MSLGEQLDGAKIVRYDEQSGLTLAWFGGHGVHAYTENGLEAAFWNVGDFANNDADEAEVLESMEERINGQDYEDYS